MVKHIDLNWNITRLECKVFVCWCLERLKEDWNITRLECKVSKSPSPMVPIQNWNITRLECKDKYLPRLHFPTYPLEYNQIGM